MHAVLHLGVRIQDTISTLRALSASGKTDWTDFGERRAQAFDMLDAASHEFLAQGVTYACLFNLPDQQASHLKGVFQNLEAKQPQHYVVPEDIKAGASKIDWSLALHAARQEIDVFRGENFSMCDGLIALAREFGSNDSGITTAEREWIAEFSDAAAVNALRRELFLASERQEDTGDVNSKLLVDRFSGLKVEVFAREHPPPHFRVKCGGESANYKIADCAQLNGSLSREYRAIRKWHAEHKGQLIAAWNQHRPSDCPVGKYRDV